MTTTRGERSTVEHPHEDVRAKWIDHLRGLSQTEGGAQLADQIMAYRMLKVGYTEDGAVETIKEVTAVANFDVREMSNLMSDCHVRLRKS